LYSSGRLFTACSRSKARFFGGQKLLPGGKPLSLWHGQQLRLVGFSLSISPTTGSATPCRRSTRPIAIDLVKRMKKSLMRLAAPPIRVN